MGTRLSPARLALPDVARLGAAGLRTRPLRAFLSALGIAIGIAAMVAVVGISASSRAGLQRELAKLGTNLLTVSAGHSFSGDETPLPSEAVDMVGRIDGVTGVSGTGPVDAHVYRTDRIPESETKGIAVLAARTDLLVPIGGRLTSGVWLNDATARGQAVVLGAATARALGIYATTPDTKVWLGGHWFAVVGILAANPLATELDTAALIGWTAARDVLAVDVQLGTMYVRTAPDVVSQVRELLARTTKPEHPNEVSVERPSDALAAQRATDRALTGLLLGLGGVALLVGGVGVANTMIISVLERRAEIGLRRAIGATRGQIRIQFLAESLLLSALGGCGGVLLGGLVTAGYAATQDWPPSVPAWVVAGGIAATVAIGGIAGLYPAVRASRLSPTEALAGP